MEHSSDPTQGILAAVELKARKKGEYRLSHLWSFDFGGPSTASPLRIDDTLYFDGFRPSQGAPFGPQAFAVRDGGKQPRQRFQLAVADLVPASMAQDPRGGLWLYSLLLPVLSRHDERTGELLQSIDLAALLPSGGAYVPASAMTIAGTESDPVMLVTAASLSAAPNYLVAIDLSKEALLWAWSTGDEMSAGQFPILLGADGPRIVFSSRTSGARPRRGDTVRGAAIAGCRLSSSADNAYGDSTAPAVLTCCTSRLGTAARNSRA
jgi:hypothetical protein